MFTEDEHNILNAVGVSICKLHDGGVVTMDNYNSACKLTRNLVNNIIK